MRLPQGHLKDDASCFTRARKSGRGGGGAAAFCFLGLEGFPFGPGAFSPPAGFPQRGQGIAFPASSGGTRLGYPQSHKGMGGISPGSLAARAGAWTVTIGILSRPIGSRPHMTVTQQPQDTQARARPNAAASNAIGTPQRQATV